MASLEDEVQGATRALGELRRAAEQSARGEKQREQERSALGSVAGGVLSQLGQFGLAGARGFGVSGNAADASGAVHQAALGFLDRVTGGVLTGGMNETLQGASREVLDTTQDYARYGIEMDPGARQRLIDQKIEQNRRMTADRTRVGGEVYTFANEEKAIQEGSPIDRLLNEVIAIKDALKGLTGGGVR